MPAILILQLLISEFYRFVRAKHKQKFNEICVQLTGQSAESKGDNPITKKRVSQDDCTGGNVKKQRTDGSTSASVN